MANNPNVAQGSLNRLLASIVVADFPALNVTPAFLAKEGIAIAFEGPVTTTHESLTGVVTSPEPYQMATVTINMLRTTGLADQYKRQLEANSVIGTVTVRPDTNALSPWQLNNCSITGVPELSMAGNDPRYVVTIRGQYYINQNLWG